MEVDGGDSALPFVRQFFSTGRIWQVTGWQRTAQEAFWVDPQALFPRRPIRRGGVGQFE